MINTNNGCMYPEVIDELEKSDWNFILIGSRVIEERSNGDYDFAIQEPGSVEGQNLLANFLKKKGFIIPQHSYSYSNNKDKNIACVFHKCGVDIQIVKDLEKRLKALQLIKEKMLEKYCRMSKDQRYIVWNIAENLV